jgi:predicted dehydrogenase
MATCHADALEMLKASEETGKKLMISHQQRFGGDIQMIKRRQEAGFFGDIYFIRAAWRRPRRAIAGITRYARHPNGGLYDRNWFNEKDRGGGVLRDLGTHMIDLALYITDFPELDGAYGNLYRKFYPPDYDGSFTVDSEDLAAAHIKFAGGLSVQLEVSFGSHIENEVVLTEIYGTKGGASRRFGEVRFFSGNDDDSCVEKATDSGIITQSSQAHFIDAILNGTPVPITAAEGAQVVRVMDAVYASGDIIF